MTNRARLFAAVEAGGTKFAVAIGNERGEILCQERFPTSDPVATLATVVSRVHALATPHGELAAIGVGCFGPVQLDQRSEQYGFIGRTPKAGWSSTDVAGTLARAFGVPVGFDTDTNAAALAEHRWGGARDVKSFVYLTIGTGIGGGVIVDGAPIHGLMHPEVGHGQYPSAARTQTPAAAAKQ